MPYVYSTLTSANIYTFTQPGGADLPVVSDRIMIYGGANVADRKTLYTPQGVMTEVTSEQLEKLKSHPVFKMHVDGGYVSYRNDKVAEEVAVTSGMENKDASAPLVEADFDDENGPKLSVSEEKKSKGRK